MAKQKRKEIKITKQEKQKQEKIKIRKEKQKQEETRKDNIYFFKIYIIFEKSFVLILSVAFFYMQLIF